MSIKNEKKRRKFEDGTDGGTLAFKDSSVKKLFIVAIAPSTQENYNNVFKIWNLLDFNQLLYIISTDLKLAKF